MAWLKGLLSVFPACAGVVSDGGWSADRCHDNTLEWQIPGVLKKGYVLLIGTTSGVVPGTSQRIAAFFCVQRMGHQA